MTGRAYVYTVLILLQCCFMPPRAVAVGVPSLQETGLQQFEQQRRSALVIGNNAYREFPIDNSVNDARDMSDLLTRAGFHVTLLLDAGGAAMAEAVDDFTESLQAGDIALFYYSGHGMEIDGSQYLSPTDCEAPDDVLYKHRAVSLNRVLKQMEHAGTWLNILVVDACRTDPYKGPSRQDFAFAAGGVGHGTVIIFGTSPHLTAPDQSNEENGLFTRHLLEELERPGAALANAFHRTSNRTYEASFGMQKPWMAVSRSGGEFILFPTEEQVNASRRTESGGGSLRVTVNEGEAEVFVDGLTVALLPRPGTYEIDGIEPGERAVTVMRMGFSTDIYRKSINVEQGRVTPLEANLSVGLTADYVLDRALEFIGGLEAVRSVNTITGQGTISVPQMRLYSQVNLYWKRPRKMRLEMTLRNLRFYQWTDGHGFWQQVAGRPAYTVGGDEAGNFMHMASVEGPYIDRWSKGVEARYEEEMEYEGKKLHHIVVTYDDGKVLHYYYNVDDFRLELMKSIVKTGTGIADVYVKYSDYRNVDGVNMAFKVSVHQSGVLVLSFQANSVTFNTDLNDSLFRAP